MMNDIIYQQIVDHLCLVSASKYSDNILLIIEKEYLKQSPKIFWNCLQEEIVKRFSNVTVVQYETDTNSRTTVCFSATGDALSRRKLKVLFENSDACFDFLTTGESFYKELLPYTDKLKSVMVVRLSPLSWTAFSYNRTQIRAIGYCTEYIRRYLQLQKHFKIKVKGLTISILDDLYLYTSCGKLSSTLYPGELRILPLEIVSFFTSKSKVIGIKPTLLSTEGTLYAEDALVDVITERRGSIRGKLILDFRKNTLIKLQINGKNYIQHDTYKIVHVTFGTNPFIKNHYSRSELAERKYGWTCIGFENFSRRHIDVCLPHRLFEPISNISHHGKTLLSIFWDWLAK